MSEPTRTAGQSRSVSDAVDTIDVFEMLRRQRWLIAFMTMLGLALGVTYAVFARPWYTSQAKVLIAEKSAGLSSGNTGTDIVEEDVLANHMELILSRRIVGEALQEYNLMELPSVVAEIGGNTDAIDYVIKQIEIEKGGEGQASGARSLLIEFTHTNPDDAQRLLTAVMKRYEAFIISQVEQVMGRANEMVQRAKSEVETDLNQAEQIHLASRQEAPLFFTGEGSSNVFQDRYSRLQEEMLDLDLKESTIRTRLSRVVEALAEINKTPDQNSHLDKLALIDSESLERLGVFAGLQNRGSNTAEFQASMPAKAEEARTEITGLLKLQAEKQRYETVYGPGHPKVQEIAGEIELVKRFIEDSKRETAVEKDYGDSMLTTEDLLQAYMGFLRNDLAAFEQRRSELESLIADAETKARQLIEFELQDLVLQKRIERQEALFDGIVQQLRDLDTASGLSGYLYEFLEVPRLGKKSWPKLSLCGLGGLLFGGLLGLGLATANDVRDGRFHSVAEVDSAIGLPSLGHVGKLPSIKKGIAGLIAGETSPDAEAFRLGRTVMLPAVRSGKLRTLGLTSPMQGDGKSTVTANYAVSFAHLNLRVLVIDADLRRPSVHRYFSVEQEQGLCELLQNERGLQIKDVIKETSVENVSVITAGGSTSEPTELLQCDRFDEVLQEVRHQFDLVIFDLPPILAVSDPIVVLPRLDGCVLVVRVAQARRDEVFNTMRRIRECGVETIGCMLNVFGAGKRFDTGGGYYGYYRSDYTKRTRRPESARPAASARPAMVTAGSQAREMADAAVNGRPPTVTNGHSSAAAKAAEHSVPRHSPPPPAASRNGSRLPLVKAED